MLNEKDPISYYDFFECRRGHKPKNVYNPPSKKQIDSPIGTPEEAVCQHWDLAQ